MEVLAYRRLQNSQGVCDVIVTNELDTFVNGNAVYTGNFVHSAFVLALVLNPDQLMNYDDIYQIARNRALHAPVDPNMQVKLTKHSIAKTSQFLTSPCRSVLAYNILRFGSNPGFFALCTDVEETDSLQAQIRNLRIWESHKRRGLHKLDSLKRSRC